MKKIAFSTWCTDDYINKVGLEGLKNSLAYFHPEIPLFVYDTEKTQGLKIQWGALAKPYFMMPLTCIDLAEGYDMVIHIDADSTVTGPLTELLESDEDIIGVVNNNSQGKAGRCPGITIQDIPVADFLNAGLVGSNNLQFWRDWRGLNHRYGEKFEGHEQDVLNIMAKSEDFSVKILDPIGSEISYGQSNVWGTETHWDSWSLMYMKDNQLCLDDPVTEKTMVVKVLHQAGGNASIYPMRPWMDSIVADDVRDYLHIICNERQD